MTENCKGSFRILSSSSHILHTLSAMVEYSMAACRSRFLIRTIDPVSEPLPWLLSIFELLFYLSVWDWEQIFILLIKSNSSYIKQNWILLLTAKNPDNIMKGVFVIYFLIWELKKFT